LLFVVWFSFFFFFFFFLFSFLFSFLFYFLFFFYFIFSFFFFFFFLECGWSVYGMGMGIVHDMGGIDLDLDLGRVLGVGV